MGSVSGREAHDIEGDAADGQALCRARPHWLVRQVRVLAVLDAIAAAGATFLAKLLVVGFAPETLSVRSWEVPYVALAFVSVPAWLLVLTTSRCYDLGPLGDSQGEIRRVVSAAAHFVALIAVAYYLVRIEQLGRDLLVAIVPLATGLTLAFRAAARWNLSLLRLQDRAVRRTAVVGPAASVTRLLDHLASHPGTGLEPVAVVVASDEPTLRGDLWQLPVVGSPDDVMAALAHTDADLLVVTGGYEPGQLRRLTWRLEGSGVDVMVSPTGARPSDLDLEVRDVAGLPLLYLNNGTSNGGGPTGANAP